MSCFDALYWNALQVLAWVCLSDQALVSRCSDGTGSGDRWYWTEHKVVSEGGDLHNTFVQTPSDPPTELTVALYASVLDRASVIADAKLEIWQKLAEGNLTVTGKHKGSRVRRQIAVLEWCDLSIDYDKRSAVDRVSRNEVYEYLMFRREAVLRLWPDVLAVEQEQPTKEGQIADGIATAPEAAEARMPRPGERRTRKGGKNPGDGARNDDPYLIRMVHIIAENEATSPNAAALQIAGANNGWAENAHRRLSTKFIEKYSSKRRDREPWGDVCRRIVDELQTK